LSYQNLREIIEKEKDTDREAEKNIFKIIARQNEIRNIISVLNNRLEIINRQEASFKQELGEAGIMVGREAVDYREEMSKVTADLHTQNSRQEQDERKKKIERSKIRLEDYGASGGSEVLKEYRETEERDTFLQKELEDLIKAKEELLNLIKDLDIRIDLEFKSGIAKINSEFGKYFTLMFGGGHAQLEVVREIRKKKSSDVEDLNNILNDQNDSMESDGLVEAEQEKEGLEGLDVSISLPKKRVKGLMMLSGGERALTSIALLFAISQVNPPPFIILDETDAALDEANSRKYGDMIEDLSKRSQLILITHNRETMSRAGVIYGITMGADGASRLLSIAFEDAVAVAK
jgi:chromosome segregation protein